MGMADHAALEVELLGVAQARRPQCALFGAQVGAEMVVLELVARLITHPQLHVRHGRVGVAKLHGVIDQRLAPRCVLARRVGLHEHEHHLLRQRRRRRWCWRRRRWGRRHRRCGHLFPVGHEPVGSGRSGARRVPSIARDVLADLADLADLASGGLGGRRQHLLVPLRF